MTNRQYNITNRTIEFPFGVESQLVDAFISNLKAITFYTILVSYMSYDSYPISGDTIRIVAKCSGEAVSEMASLIHHPVHK